MRSPPKFAVNSAYLGDEQRARRKTGKFLRSFGAIWQGGPTAGPRDYVRWVVEVSTPWLVTKIASG